MKLFIRTVLFHLLCILAFSFLYFNLKDSFKVNNNEKQELTLIDYLFLSTTVQAGVGLSDIYPVTFYSKLAMIVQQVVMLCIHVFMVYIFTL